MSTTTSVSSSITHHSHITSSSSSSSPYPPSSSQHQPPLTRCIGLNLLVKAIHQVTNGSIIGVPYFQRRIITRRKRPIQFTNLIISTHSLQKPKPKKTRKPPTAKRQKRVNATTLPAKFKDFSVFQPLTPKRRSSSLSSSSSSVEAEVEVDVDVDVEVDIIGD